MTDTRLSVDVTPASIEANFDALDREVAALVEPYRGATYDLTDQSALSQAKRDRSYLNAVAKEIDDRRKAVKREYLKPLQAFEARANEIAGRARDASAAIKAQLDRAEEDRRAALRDRLREHYEGFAGLLADVVPYERVHEDRWLLKSFGEVKAQQAVEERVTQVARDWDALKAQEGMPCWEVAEREFFASLDLGAALRAARDAQEAQERIRAMREATEPAPAPEPEPVMDEPVWVEPGEAYVVRVDSMTRAQVAELREWLRARGLHGTITKA